MGIKVVILCGGAGTRLREETEIRPKPMVEIGGMPILWHIMKRYANYGFNEFILCLGYKDTQVRVTITNIEFIIMIANARSPHTIAMLGRIKYIKGILLKNMPYYYPVNQVL